MESRIDTAPDADVHALQTVDAILMRARMDLRPALLRAEQRQRDRELRAGARKAARTNDDASLLEQRSA